MATLEGQSLGQLREAFAAIRPLCAVSAAMFATHRNPRQKPCAKSYRSLSDFGDTNSRRSALF
jgi:hypothetical protein